MVNTTESSSEPSNDVGGGSPLIVAGMPRCGSTIFTQLLNQSQDLLVINDLYYLQFVDGIGSFDSCDAVAQKKLVEYIEHGLIGRIERVSSQGIRAGIKISPEQESKILSFIRNFEYSPQKDWASILEEILEYASCTSGNKIWGYNTPQDYLNLDLIRKTYPDSKIVFVIRDCRSMLSSYKYIDESYENSRSRYHPVLQSLAWRTAVRAFNSYKISFPDDILLVRYEDLVSDTQATMQRVAKFTTANFPSIDLKDFEANSSFKGRKRKFITSTEVWLCERIVAKELKQLGYSISDEKPKLKDLSDLLKTTLRASGFYLHQIITSANIRKRILKLVKKISS